VFPSIGVGGIVHGDGLGGKKMLDHQAPTKLIWLLAGLLVGALATAGLVWVVMTLVRGNAPEEAAGPPRYVEETVTSGVDHVYDGEFQFFVGGGGAVFDCNADMFPDLYLAGGTEPAGLYVNLSPLGGPLAFAKQTDASTDLVDVTGAYPIDVDSDGVTDLAVLRVGENVMLRGLGDCLFERANEIWGIDGGEEWTAAFSATWEDSQSLPTLAFGNYLADGEPGGREECASNYLVRPEDGYGPPVELTPGWCTLSILFSDWSRSGQADLRMTNDRHYYIDGEEQLWRIASGAEPEPYTAEDGWRSMQIWGMGIASHDLTGDGLPEVFLTSQGDNKLQTLTEASGRPSYEDVALTMGATAHRPFMGDTNRPSTAWHAEFGDVNNDGFVDLFVTKGNVDDMVEFAGDDPNNLLLGQPDGTFEESADQAGVLDYSRSRGGALTDLNLDGYLDMVVIERREPVKVWRNTGEPTGNWLAVDLTQPPPNGDGIGSWVEVRLGNAIIRTEHTIGGGHAGGQLGWIHFGLGKADEADIRVTWPDGVQGPWTTVAANRFITLERGSNTIIVNEPMRN